MHELSSQHEKALEKIKEEARVEALSSSANELRKKLLTFSQFLRAAAAKRTIEEEADTDESRAFEGALLLVYGGDQKAVETAVNIIEGANERVPSIEGIELAVTCKSLHIYLAFAYARALHSHHVLHCLSWSHSLTHAQSHKSSRHLSTTHLSRTKRLGPTRSRRPRAAKHRPSLAMRLAPPPTQRSQTLA